MEQSNKELQSIVWSEVSEKPSREGEFDLSNNAIEEAVMADKIALLRIIDGMIHSIYKRAKLRKFSAHGRIGTQYNCGARRQSFKTGKDGKSLVQTLRRSDTNSHYNAKENFTHGRKLTPAKLPV